MHMACCAGSTGLLHSVFGWPVIFEKAAVSNGLWKNHYKKTAVGKVEDCLRAVVNCVLWVKYL
jgi:hypothetical protein